MSTQSIKEYGSAFSKTILVKTSTNKDKFIELTDEIDQADVTEVGILATKRRVLKEILKIVGAEKKVSVEASPTSSDEQDSASEKTEEVLGKRTGS